MLAQCCHYDLDCAFFFEEEKVVLISLHVLSSVILLFNLTAIYIYIYICN